jgi:hypothetical protein
VCLGLGSKCECGTYGGGRRNPYGGLVVKTEGRSLLRRPECGEESSFKMGLKEIECVAWTGSVWFRTGTSGGGLGQSGSGQGPVAVDWVSLVQDKDQWRWTGSVWFRRGTSGSGLGQSGLGQGLVAVDWVSLV